MTAIEIYINGERFTLEQGKVESYSCEFRRVVSLEQLHDFALQVKITPISGNISVEIKSGIDGRVTNSGAQHFTDSDKRFADH